MRLFVGIPIAAPAIDELAALRQRLEATVPVDRAGELRWSTPESWHITLQFLGQTTPEQLACLGRGLQSLAAESFPVQLGRLGVFDRAGALFAEVTSSAALTGLQERIVSLTRPCGFTPEERPYHPHVTLARRRGRPSGLLRTLADQTFSAVTFTAEQVVLYESMPASGGSRYLPKEIAVLRSTVT